MVNMEEGCCIDEGNEGKMNEDKHISTRIDWKEYENKGNKIKEHKDRNKDDEVCERNKIVFGTKMLAGSRSPLESSDELDESNK